MNQCNKGVRARALVIGAGVSGLTCGLVLRRRGFEVAIVAEQFAPHITSAVAGALWEWPPAVCGYHHDQISLARSKKWCADSYDMFVDLANRPETGVFLRTANFYFKQRVDANPTHLAKMNELQQTVRNFVHDPELIAANGVNRECGVCDAYAHLAPMIDTDAYMAWLLDEVRRSGCLVSQERICGPLREQENILKDRFQADVLVNCAGLGSSELAKEAMFPLRGALIRIRNDGKAIPRITEAHCLAHQDKEQGFIFIVPRGQDRLVLGGLAEPGEWNLQIGLDNYAPIRRMMNRCIQFMPALAGARIDEAEPVRVGLRPCRKQNVRLEHEPGTHIVHNYGHGGSGVTFSWGCAFEVADSVEQLLAWKR
jgi:D-amino-acid oxidase